MDQIPIRVVNQHTAEVLARVENGETVEITNRGRVIRRSVPAGPGELDDWIAEGVPCPRPSGGRSPCPRARPNRARMPAS